MRRTCRHHGQLSAISGFFDLNFFHVRFLASVGLTPRSRQWSMNVGRTVFAQVMSIFLPMSLRNVWPGTTAISKAQLFLLGSVSLSQLRATDLSRKLAKPARVRFKASSAHQGIADGGHGQQRYRGRTGQAMNHANYQRALTSEVRQSNSEFPARRASTNG